MIDLSKYQPSWIPISQISLDNKAFQFRKDINPASVAELGKSLAADGQAASTRNSTCIFHPNH